MISGVQVIFDNVTSRLDLRFEQNRDSGIFRFFATCDFEKKTRSVQFQYKGYPRVDFTSVVQNPGSNIVWFYADGMQQGGFCGDENENRRVKSWIEALLDPRKLLIMREGILERGEGGQYSMYDTVLNHKFPVTIGKTHWSADTFTAIRHGVTRVSILEIDTESYRGIMLARFLASGGAIKPRFLNLGPGCGLPAGRTK